MCALRIQYSCSPCSAVTGAASPEAQRPASAAATAAPGPRAAPPSSPPAAAPRPATAACRQPRLLPRARWARGRPSAQRGGWVTAPNVLTRWRARLAATERRCTQCPHCRRLVVPPEARAAQRASAAASLVASARRRHPVTAARWRCAAVRSALPLRRHARPCKRERTHPPPHPHRLSCKQRGRTAPHLRRALWLSKLRTGMRACHTHAPCALACAARLASASAAAS